MIEGNIPEKALELAGEWLVSNYLATDMGNVPMFVKADNAEDKTEKYRKAI